MLIKTNGISREKRTWPIKGRGLNLYRVGGYSDLLSAIDKGYAPKTEIVTKGLDGLVAITDSLNKTFYRRYEDIAKDLKEMDLTPEQLVERWIASQSQV